MTEQFIIIALLYLLLGVVIGFIAGTYGLGGGLVLVPALIWIFQYQQAPLISHEAQLHLAIGTSRAVLIITVLRAIFAHYKHHIKFWDVYRKMMLGLIIGVLIGTPIGYKVHVHHISRIFGFFIILLSLPMFFLSTYSTDWKLPGRLGTAIVSGIIGVLSGIFGLAGSTYTMLFLLYCNVPMRKAILISLTTGFTIAVTGIFLSFTLTHVNQSLLWSNPSTVYWPAWFFISLGSLLTIPFGVSFSYRLSRSHLHHSLASILVLVGVCLLFSPL